MKAKTQKTPQNIAVSAPSQELITRKPGRPSTFSMELVEEICQRMAAGEIPSQICKDDRMPSQSTLRDWRLASEDVSAMYARAYELLCEYWAEDLIAIGDDARNDWMERELRNAKGEVVGTVRVVDQENINRSRLRSDNRKWLLAKLMRHKYGDKVDMTMDATVRPAPPVDSARLEAVANDPVEVARLYQDMIAAGRR